MGPLGILGTPMDGGTLRPLPPTASREQQIAAINDMVGRLNNMLKSQIFSDGTNKRMLIGYQKDGWGPGKDFGMKVSIEGVDVTAATEQQLLFKMDLGTWYFYDPESHNNFMQMGILPDKTGGWAVAKEGMDVKDAY